MKKILKKLTALMLSLVMIFGCIPSFINEVSATELSEWGKLNSAMSEDGVESVDGVFTIENDESADTRTIVLLKDIKATSEDTALEVTNLDTKIILDLNGHILNRGLILADGTESYHDNGSVIEIVGGALEINDSAPTVEHDGFIDANGLWHLAADNHPAAGEEAKTIYGGIITGGTGKNASPYGGGGIYVSSNGTTRGSLILTSGNICGNSGLGGGVRISSSDFIMNGGCISYNIYKYDATRKSNTGNPAGLLISSGDFTMTDGEISYNTATGENSIGGIYTGSITTIKGGKIIGNKSEGLAGGICAGSQNFTISGKVIIKDNINTGKESDGTTSLPQNIGNIINNSTRIKVEKLLSGTEIYVSGIVGKANKPGLLTSGYKNNNSSAGLDDFFHYDGPDKFCMILNADGELEIVEKYKLINIISDHGTVTTNLTNSYADTGTEVTLTVTPDSYYELETLEVKDSDDNPIELVNNTFTKGDNAVTITATYKELPRPTGTKKYKADDKDTAEKVSGSGKKGSTRTITPIEGKKVASVIVTDKDGNKVDVTLNEDGTYSFVQPASNVDVQVIYKNREIVLNIGSTNASVDGEKSNLDVAPVIRNDRTMLPIRFVAENLGAKVEWNELEPNMVYITRGDIKIEIKLGSNIAKVNGKEYELDSVAFAENDRTYLPVRFVSEALNAIVEWNESKPNEVKIYEQ